MAALEAANAGIVSTDERRVSTGVNNSPRWRIHKTLALLCGILFLLCCLGGYLTDTPDFPNLLALAIFLSILSLPALFWQDRGHPEKRDAALMLPWAGVLLFVMPFLAVLSARLQFPLQDAALSSIDHAFGWNAVLVHVWIFKHPWSDDLFDRIYLSLFIVLPAAVLLPPLFGKRRASEIFILANAIAFLVALPFCVLIPAIGPWVGGHFQPSAAQMVCERSIRMLHAAAPLNNMAYAGVLTFPSFHVIWAILAASALGAFRSLRAAAIFWATLVAISTLATGWHYFTDVLGGIVVAVFSLAAARRIAE